jgi:predicted site-specific integrase-resolvase
MEKKYLSGKKASKIIGVHPRTLYNWEKQGKITALRSPGGMRLYDVTNFIKSNKDLVTSKKHKYKICYCRVSSNGQKNDLQRQIKYMEEKYPKYKIISDIGSGINFNRIGLRKIIKYAIDGKIDTVVVAYKDRLTRFGFELIEFLISEYSNGKIIIENKKDLTKENELLEDLMQIMNVFVAKINGKRKYAKHTEK